MTRQYRNPLAADVRVRRDLDLGALTSEEREVGDYILDNSPRSLEQITVGVNLPMEVVREMMEARNWYSHLPTPARSQHLDPLIQEGHSVRGIATRAGWQTARVQQYIVSWGLEEYHQQCRERRSRAGPALGKKKKAYLEDRKTYEAFDPSKSYRGGEVLFFPACRFVGTINKVFSERIQVELLSGETREFRHRLEPHSPYVRCTKGG